eukprot:scaffold40869_cov66-Phaeocystis_antarctica.AAC.4
MACTPNSFAAQFRDQNPKANVEGGVCEKLNEAKSCANHCTTRRRVGSSYHSTPSGMVVSALIPAAVGPTESSAQLVMQCSASKTIGDSGSVYPKRTSTVSRSAASVST